MLPGQKLSELVHWARLYQRGKDISILQMGSSLKVFDVVYGCIFMVPAFPHKNTCCYFIVVLDSKICSICVYLNYMFRCTCWFLNINIWKKIPLNCFSKAVL